MLQLYFRYLCKRVKFLIKGHLESTLEDEKSDVAKIKSFFYYSETRKIAISCPYSGDKANDEFRDSVFKRL